MCVCVCVCVNRLKLDREEAARNNAFKARVDQLSKFSNKYENEVGQKKREDESRTIAKTNQELEQKDRVTEQSEKLKLDIRKRDTMRNFEYNLNMMEEKRRQKDKSRMEALEARLRMQDSQRVAEDQERKESQEKRMRRLEIKLKLDEQVQQKQQFKTSDVALTLAEKEFNKVNNLFYSS